MSQNVDVFGKDLHSFKVHDTRFDVPLKYTVIEPVGQGAYGVVCAARDDSTSDHVAIKKIENAFEHVTFTKRTLRELRILRFLQHENIVGIREIFISKTKVDFTDVYVVCELMETDLASILKSNQPLSQEHCQFFLYQILRGMKYVHSAHVIHRDLKPRNLLVNSNCDLKICDFGLARANFNDDVYKHTPLTEYVCTRWYRAPEVLCSWSDYTEAIDVWSIGCILGEMLNRKPLFPGHNTQHQLQLVVKLMGSPTTAEVACIPNEKCRKFISQIEKQDRKPYKDVFPTATPPGLDLLERMLCFDQNKRCTVVDALEHVYMAGLHCPEDEPIRAPLSLHDFEFERRRINVEILREELFQELLRYYPGKLPEYLEENHGLIPQITNYRLLEPGETQQAADH